MNGTFPIITCDDESGCPEWTLDWYTATASNWASLMEPGWQYDPYSHSLPHLCPEHAPRPCRITADGWCAEHSTADGPHFCGATS